MRSSSIVPQLAFSLAALTGLSAAFPSPANLALLAERDGLTPRGILTGLAQLKQKKAIGLDASTQPIQGANIEIHIVT